MIGLESVRQSVKKAFRDNGVADGAIVDAEKFESLITAAIANTLDSNDFASHVETILEEIQRNKARESFDWK